jgi:hypothetical protein
MRRWLRLTAIVEEEKLVLHARKYGMCRVLRIPERN